MLLDIVTKGTTNYSCVIRIADSTDGTPETGVVHNTTGIDLWYRRPASAHSSITEVTQTEGGAHTDGGFVHISDGNYRLDLPDAAVATGADYVDVGGTVTGMVVYGGRIRLTDVDLGDGVRGGMTALPNAAADAAGGLPISDAGGLDMDAIKTDTAAILVDTGTTLDTKINDIQGATFSSATDSLEAIRNRGDSAWTGSAVTSDTGTAQAGSASTITLRSGASAANDTYNGQVIFITGGTGVGQSRAISDYVGSTKVATVITNWTTNPDATSTYDIYPDEITEITQAPTAAAVADAVWDENTTGHTTAGTFGEQVKNDIDAILTDTGTTLDAAIATIDANVDAILLDTAEIGAAGAGLTALATQASVNTIDSNVDAILVDTGTTLPGLLGTPAGASVSADVAAIKAETATILTDTGTTLDTKLNNLQTTADAVETDTQNIQSRLPTALNNGMMPSDVQRINDVALTGDGSGTPFDVV